MTPFSAPTGVASMSAMQRNETTTVPSLHQLFRLFQNIFADIFFLHKSLTLVCVLFCVYIWLLFKRASYSLSPLYWCHGNKWKGGISDDRIATVATRGYTGGGCFHSKLWWWTMWCRYSLSAILYVSMYVRAVIPKPTYVGWLKSARRLHNIYFYMTWVIAHFFFFWGFSKD